MPMSSTAALTPLQETKKHIREQAHANRKAQTDKEELSQKICETFASLPEYAAARTVMFYIDVRTRGPHAALSAARC